MHRPLLGLGLLLWSVLAFAQVQAPPLTGRLLASHEQATGNQLVVVTLPDLGGRSIEETGLALGRQWGIGQQGKDNGALLIVAQAERRIRIEVGYGLEGSLTDAQSTLIIHN